MLSKLFFPNTASNKHFVHYLRNNGAQIGNGTRFIDPKKCHIDPGRLDYIEIGCNCCLSVVSIIAHDYSWYILASSHRETLPDSGSKVKIGNNCFIGYQAVILKGSTIGDNVIIGARSVVKGIIPSNSVWAGVPARQICTLDQYFNIKFNNRLKDAFYRRDHIKDVYRRNPKIEEMGFFCFLFLERNYSNYDRYIKQLEFNGVKDSPLIKDLFFSSEPLFLSYDDFLVAQNEVVANDNRN